MKNLCLGVALFGASVATLQGQVPWKTMTSPTTETLRAVCFADSFGSWYAVGDAGTILGSGDFVRWTAQASGTTRALTGITFGYPVGRGVIVAVGADGTILTKGPDSNGWTARMSGTQARLNAVALGGGVLLAVGDGGTALTSTDGINWVRQNSGTLESLTSVAYGNGRFIVTARHPAVLLSADHGTTFQRRLLDASLPSDLDNVAVFGGNRFYVTGTSGVFTSPDGDSWNRIGGAWSGGETARAAAYFDGMLLTIGDGGFIRDELGNTRNLGAEADNWLGAGSNRWTVFVVGAGGRSAFHELPLVTEPRTTVADLSAGSRFGVIDQSFRPALNAQPDSVLPLSDGRVYVAGIQLSFSVGGRTQSGIARLNRDGSVDATFNAGVGLDLQALAAQQYADQQIIGAFSRLSLVAQRDGRIVAFAWLYYGYYGNSALEYVAVARFNPDGSRDPAFQPAQGLRYPRTLPLVLADGRWLVCTPTRDPAGNRIVNLERFTPDGLADSTFGNPTLTSPIPAAVPTSYLDLADPWNQIALPTMDAQHRIYLVTSYGFTGYVHGIPGQRTEPTSQNTLLFRLNPDGTPDQGFVVRALNQPSALDATEGGLVCQQTVWNFPRSQGGTTTLQRLRFDGTVDPSFRATTMAHSYSSYTTSAAGPDGSVFVLTQAARGHSGVLRFTATGEYDPNFSVELGGTTSAITKIYPLANGQLLAVGSSTSIGGEGVRYLARIQPDTLAAATRLTNLSVRANPSSGGGTLIAGFIVQGGERTMLLRGAGPSLSPFGISNALADPTIALYKGADSVAANDDWESGPVADLAAIAARVKAFPFAAGSGDAALIATAATGAHTIHVSGKGASTGVSLAEIYDTNFRPSDPQSARFTNFSARANAGLGNNTLIAGFVLQGNSSRTILLRAVGPGLAKFNVPGFLTNPVLTLFRGTTPVARNDNWGDSATDADALRCLEATRAAGAFPLEVGSMDAMLLVTIAPGAYTAEATSGNGVTGIALLEIFEIP